MTDNAVGKRAATERVSGLTRLPYPPSWVDRFTDWVRGLPGPDWLFYLLLGVAIRLTSVTIQTLETGSSNLLSPFPAVIAFALPYALGLIHYLDDSATSALAQFRPSMAVDEAEYAQIRYKLSTMPARPTLLISIGGAVFILSLFFFIGLDFFTRFGVFISPFTTAFQIVLNIVLWGVLGVLFYHTFRQLGLVSRIYASYTDIKLFRLHPVYAFSSLTARTAFGFILVVYAFLIAAPGLLDRPETAASLAVFVLFAVITFAWPLLGAHRLLVEEKEQSKAEVGQRLEATVAELHRRVDAGDLEGRDALRNTIDGLIAEQAVIDKIPTWPWQPETVRGLAAAILLPLVVWGIQRVLERLGF